jgi:glutaredoxin
LYEGDEMEKFRKAYPELRTSPQIFCDGENIGGFDDLIEWDPGDLQ